MAYLPENRAAPRRRSFLNIPATTRHMSYRRAVGAALAVAFGGFVPGAAIAEANEDEDHTSIGLGAIVTPKYEGGRDLQVKPLPIIDIHQGRFFADWRNGVGIKAIHEPWVTVGMSAVYMPGYKDTSVPPGVGKLGDGAGARLFAEFRFGDFQAIVGGIKTVSGGTGGFIADLSLNYEYELNDRVSLKAGVLTTWADTKYTDRYFGINQAQSAASGLPEYHPEGGFKDVSFALSANIGLTERTILTVSAGAARILGDAARSPLVQRRIQPLGVLALTYTF